MTDAPLTQLVLGEQKSVRSLTGEVVLDQALVEGVSLSAVGLEITDPAMKIEVWLRIGRMLGNVHRTMNWWIGDWINKGEVLFGHEASQGVEGTISDRYNEAERITGLNHQTLLNISYVCANIARSRRRADLSWAVHREVAKLDADEQKKWLKLTHDNNWSSTDLVEALREAGLRGGRRAELNGGSEGSTRRGSGGGTGEDWEDPVRAAAKRVYHQGTVRNGEAHVPIEAWSQLEAALEDE